MATASWPCSPSFSAHDSDFPDEAQYSAGYPGSLFSWHGTLWFLLFPSTKKTIKGSLFENREKMRKQGQLITPRFSLADTDAVYGSHYRKKISNTLLIVPPTRTLNYNVNNMISRPRSSSGKALCYVAWLARVRSRAGRGGDLSSSLSVYTGPCIHSASSKMRIWAFPK